MSADSTSNKYRWSHRPAEDTSGVFSSSIKLEFASCIIKDGLPLCGVCNSKSVTSWANPKLMFSQSLSVKIVSTGAKFSPSSTGMSKGDLPYHLR